MDPYQADWFLQYTRKKGVLVDTSGMNPIDYFMLFFSEDIFQTMADQTNLYASQYLETPDNFLKPASRLKTWSDTDVSEMKAFTAINMMMGLTRKPSIADHQSTHWASETPGFSSVMSRDRYQLLLTFLRFNDNDQYIADKTSPLYDPLFKVRTLLDITNPTYTQYYVPGQCLSIDESMMRFKGRSSFKQYMPNKPTKFGLKVYLYKEN